MSHRSWIFFVFFIEIFVGLSAPSCDTGWIEFKNNCYSSSFIYKNINSSKHKISRSSIRPTRNTEEVLIGNALRVPVGKDELESKFVWASTGNSSETPSVKGEDSSKLTSNSGLSSTGNAFETRGLEVEDSSNSTTNGNIIKTYLDDDNYDFQSDLKKNYVDAHRHCRMLGGDLVSLNTRDEEDFLYSINNSEEDFWINSESTVYMTSQVNNTDDHQNCSKKDLNSELDVGNDSNSSNTCWYMNSSRCRRLSSCKILRPFICKKMTNNVEYQPKARRCLKCKSRMKRTYFPRKERSGFPDYRHHDYDYDNHFPNDIHPIDTKIALHSKILDQFRNSKSTEVMHKVLQDLKDSIPLPQIAPMFSLGHPPRLQNIGNEDIIDHHLHFPPADLPINPWMRMHPQSRFSNSNEKSAPSDKHKESIKFLDRLGKKLHSITTNQSPVLSFQSKHRLGLRSKSTSDWMSFPKTGSVMHLPTPPSSEGSDNPTFNPRLDYVPHALAQALTNTNSDFIDSGLESSTSIDTSNLSTVGYQLLNSTKSDLLQDDYVTEPDTFQDKSSGFLRNDCQSSEDIAYEDHCYTRPNAEIVATFDEAQYQCQSIGAHLLTIKKFSDTLFINELTRHASGDIWIGLKLGLNNSFYWTDGTPLNSSLTRLLPLPLDVASGHCMTISQDTEIFTQRKCSEQKYPYICQYPIPQQRIPVDGCLEGWEEVKDRCYKTFAKPASWEDSERHCESYGAHLTSANNVEEEDILRRLAQNSEVSGFFPSLWIGLEISGNNEIRWTDGTPVGYLNWADDQRNSNRGKKKCGSASRRAFRAQKSPCSAILPFICEAVKGNMLHAEHLPQTKPSSFCEDDSSWLLYSDHCYKIISSENNNSHIWMESSHLCRGIGGELASIHSVEENYWLQSKVYSLDDEVLWIGGLSYMDSGYGWADRTPYDFTNWDKGEPNNNFDQENCIGFYTRNFGYWNDQNCGHPQGRICKRPHGATHPPPVTTPPPTGNCPTGWLDAGTKCLKFVSDLLNFDDSRNACKALNPNADLASIGSAKEQAYITAMLGEIKTNLWIGLRYDHGYHWMDQSALTFTNWAPREPSSGGWLDENASENCVNTHIYNMAGQWNNMNCKALLGFVCQLSLDPNITESDPLPTCDPPFERYVNYSGHCYRAENTTKTWKEAERVCVQEGGHLTSAANRGDNAWLWVLSQHFDLGNPWIGYNNMKDPSIFEWSNDWPTFYTKWGYGQPNSSVSNQNCAAISSDDGLWYLGNCEEERSFICKSNDETFPTPDPPSGGYCPNESWLDLGGSYCYLIMNEASPWADANQWCAYEGSDLASIHSKVELDLIIQSAYNIPDPLWIGLIQMREEFGWSDGTGLDFVYWKEGEPNSGREECTEMYPGTGLWNDNFCSNARPFVCKILKSSPVERASIIVRNGESSNTGTIVGVIIPLLAVLVIGGLYLVYRRRRTMPPSLGDRGSYGFDNALYAAGGHDQVDLNLNSPFQRNAVQIVPYDADEDEDDSDDDGDGDL